jgi:transglutaminase-like putative cysteine protease
MTEPRQMSTRTRDRIAGQLGRVTAARALVETRHVVRAGALVAALVLISSFSLVLADIVATVGDPTILWMVVTGTLVGATVLWPLVSGGQALRVGAAALVIGLVYYALAVPFGIRLWVAVQGLAELLTGRSALWIVRVELWALLVAPAPVFLTWVFALKRQYVRAAGAGGAMLCFFVLTGDADLLLTLLGVVAAGGLVGLGDVESRAHSLATAEYLAVVLAIMVVAPFVFSVVPGGSAGPLALVGDGPTTMEENVVESGTNLEIAGSVSQDPGIRFLVRGEEPRYWRTGSYDRFTGSGWIQTGESQPYEESRLERPEQVSETVTYEIEARSDVSSLPVPWRPVALDGPTDRASVAPDGAVTLDGSLDSGESYTVTSAVPGGSPGRLAAVGGDYPADIQERYTQLPSSTPDRVAERTRNIAVNASTPYETAVVIEEWLEGNREYSLDVDRPDGNIVDAFLFEMNEGYCTYYATAMAGMLRSVDIPARIAVGYTTGDQLQEDTWAVRGANSHAWVEVYLPEQGWISFDPTPSDPRTDAETGAVGVSASADLDIDSENASVDGNESDEPTEGNLSEPDRNETREPSSNPTIDEFGPGEYTPGGNLDDNESDIAGRENGSGVSTDELQSNGSERSDETENRTDSALDVAPGEIESIDPDGALLELPAYQQLFLGTLALAGLAVGVRRSPIPAVVGREMRIRVQRRRDPETDIERAHERMLLVLGKRHRPRGPGETTRQYLEAIGAGPEARKLAAIREQARYAGEHSEAAADEAVELVERVREG